MQTFFLASLEALLGIPEYFGYLFVFVIGASIGSFLNVVIYRVPNELSLLPSSKCPKCGTGIKPWHNVPILGWLMLGGKCASCKEPIAGRYPAVELLTALLFCLVYWQVGLTPYLPVALAFAATMTALVFIDAEHMILPNVITYPMFIIALIVRVVFPIAFAGNYFSDTLYGPVSWLAGYPAWAVSLAGAVLGTLVGGGLLWAVGAIWKALRGVDAMGLGDVKLLFGIGALLGWRLTLLTIFIGAFTGAVAGVALVSRQKEKDLQTQIPFGIFLGIGSIIAILFGEQLIRWYLTTFVP
ncbi:MAG TPA: prepilin peptidase [Pyrinomonadaceae bacterium]|nr:prepilin peptidase [Chloracidobacterium sp.]MBP9936695.1 prepilin peptidase [Pyrinomonadaceae bacterium]MBK9439417.1 prepilin peptidase [Chloracidobacterium sp.]MBL0239296.1 prepilin peptidase [Chloracidobacterium sp.]HQX56528.1 prepilin peptidase [Pyrinomonadaceae bacterium]